MFDTYGSYDLLKTSLFLKKVGDDNGAAFDLSSGSFTLDATNFKSITQGSNKASLGDADSSDFTGTGYMICNAYSGLTYPYMEYPVRTDAPGSYTLYMRMQSSSGTIKATLLVDGVDVATLNTTGTAGTWEWYTFTVGIPDVSIHNLGIRLEEDTLSLDKIHISQEAETVLDTGPGYDDSPFITVHLQVYEVSGNEPTNPLEVYTYKNSIEEVKDDDWYNFSLEPIDSSVFITFDGTYALVMSTSGSHRENFIVWEFVDNDEYLTCPSALMYKE